MDLTVRELLDRYGPSAAVVLVLVLLVTILPGNRRDERVSAEGPTEVTSGPVLEGGPSEPAGLPAGAPGAPDGAVAAPSGPAGPGPTAGSAATVAGSGGGVVETVVKRKGKVVKQRWGPGIFPQPGPETQCREDGKMPAFSFYSPPCVPTFKGDNGGATYRGVTRDKVKIVRVYGKVDPATEAALRALGAADTRATADRVDQALVHYYNNHVETYGREVVWENYDATGRGDNDEAARADAKTIAEELKPFLVWPSVATDVNERVLAESLAAKGVICLCTTSQGRAFYKRNYPYVWGALPVAEEYFDHLAEFIGKRMNGDPAKWAGDPAFQTKTRTFGLIFVEGTKTRVDPEFKQAVDHFERQLARYNAHLTEKFSYTFDLSKGGEQAQAAIAKMKAAGVTTLMCFCDPLTPVFFTQQATRSQYFPEHLITGTILMDTTFFGRTYDQAQWKNAFGISPLWVFFEDVSTSSGYKAYYHARPNDPRGRTACNGEPCEGVGINVRQPPIQGAIIGIQMAGPILNPTNWARGILTYRAGGNPKAPLVYYTPDSPTAIKDFTEVWWNATGRGKDETGRDGVGILMKARGGRRYQLGEWPNEDPYAFDPNGAVFTSDTPPESFPHDADGHTHGSADDPKRQRCRSCS